ncbi:hypothetical protein J4457_05810 [Candidatus Woesearchaeota archaeon]|nr:hypothetical protein [Candidatus Woesearchaeota archaeon]
MTKKNLHVWYDKESDFLEFRMRKTVKGYYKPLGNECFERVDEKTGKVVGLAIFNFTKRFPKTHRELHIPVEMILKTE